MLRIDFDRPHVIKALHQDRLFVLRCLQIGLSGSDLRIEILHLGVASRLPLQEHIVLQDGIGITEVGHDIIGASQLSSQTSDRCIESPDPVSQLVVIRLGECRVERRQQVAAVDPIAGLDMDLADNRGFQRLHHEIGAHGDQLALGRYNHVDLRHRGPGNRGENQRKNAIEREARETRWRPLLYLDRIGLEFGDQARMPGGGPEQPSSAPLNLSGRRQFIRFRDGGRFLRLHAICFVCWFQRCR